ncbi:hypothetical protein EDD86DRAFT_200176 [Gorgonomyces haynaldii]|nr:hypothetical protein EDD86DRAFT_200176 [Gorgonomyces haynaldii]
MSVLLYNGWLTSKHRWLIALALVVSLPKQVIDTFIETQDIMDPYSIPNYEALWNISGCFLMLLMMIIVFCELEFFKIIESITDIPTWLPRVLQILIISSMTIASMLCYFLPLLGIWFCNDGLYALHDMFGDPLLYLIGFGTLIYESWMTWTIITSVKRFLTNRRVTLAQRVGMHRLESLIYVIFGIDLVTLGLSAAATFSPSKIHNIFYNFATLNGHRLILVHLLVIAMVFRTTKQILLPKRVNVVQSPPQEQTFDMQKDATRLTH